MQKYNAVMLGTVKQAGTLRGIDAGALVWVTPCSNLPYPMSERDLFAFDDSGVDMLIHKTDVKRFADSLWLDESDVQLWNVLLALFASIRRPFSRI